MTNWNRPETSRLLLYLEKKSLSYRQSKACCGNSSGLRLAGAVAAEKSTTSQIVRSWNKVGLIHDDDDVDGC